MDTQNALILLVEDDRLVMYSLARGLREAGYRVLEASSGEQAIQLCLDSTPDLALLDLKLPGMSGIDFAKWLKTTHAVPFIFLSAYSDTEAVDTASELGALGYLVKPLDVSQVLPTIHTAIRRSKEILKLQKIESDLSSALRASRSTSMAIGLLMYRYKVSEDEAFKVLREYCRSNRNKVVDVAELIIQNNQEIDLMPYLKR